MYSLEILFSQFGTSPLFHVWFYLFLTCFLTCMQISQESGKVSIPISLRIFHSFL